MKYNDLLMKAAHEYNDRAPVYGSFEDLFDRACQIYQLTTGNVLTPWQAATFMNCLKMARLKHSPTKMDNYVDAMNYTAFAGQFASDAANNIDDVEQQMIRDMAAKLAPEKREQGEG